MFGYACAVPAAGISGELLLSCPLVPCVESSSGEVLQRGTGLMFAQQVYPRPFFYLPLS